MAQHAATEATRPTRSAGRSSTSSAAPAWDRATADKVAAFDPDLDDCVVLALRQMIDLLCRRTNLDRAEAYMLCSLAADLRVTQVVNGNKGIHVMLDKRYLSKAR